MVSGCPIAFRKLYEMSSGPRAFKEARDPRIDWISCSSVKLLISNVSVNDSGRKSRFIMSSILAVIVK